MRRQVWRTAFLSAAWTTSLVLPLPWAVDRASATPPPLTASAASQTAAAVPADTRSVTIPRLDEDAHVDGRLDEPVWTRAALLDGFYQYQPVDSRPAEERTEVRLFYTPAALYFGIRAFDSQPQTLRATRADRDNLGAEDSVTIYLDPFDDRRRAFFFTVNPLGAQEDGLRTEGIGNPGELNSAQIDRNPDFLFDSLGRVTEQGYEVELRIPFQSLRYPGGGGAQRWGLNVERRLRRTGYVDTWTDVRRAGASFLAQAGVLLGLRELVSDRVVEVQPFLTATADGQRGPLDGRFQRGDLDPSAGLNLRLGLSSDVSFDATYNPDFSQVESDVGQVTVNERFALFFPEKRPFFLEGIDLFATPNRLIYTRQVTDPLVGAKLTAKRGTLNLAHMSVLDDPDESRPRAFYSATRARRDLGRDSTAGAVFTFREQGPRRNLVAALDARWVFGKLYFVQAQAGGSHTETGAAPARTSPLWMLEFDRTGRAWGFNYRLTGIGTNFASDAGYVPRPNLVELSAANRGSLYGPRGSLLEVFNAFGAVERRWLYGDFGSGRPLEGTETLTTLTRLRGGWQLAASAHRTFFRFDPRAFANVSTLGPAGTRVPFVPRDGVDGAWGVFLRLDLPTFRRLDGSLQCAFEGWAIFTEAAPARRRQCTSALGVRPSAALRLSLNVVHERLVRRADGSLYAQTWLPRFKAEYQAARALFFRLVGQYRAEREAPRRDPTSGFPLLVGGQPALGFRVNELRLDALVSYEPRPGTVAFLGYGAGLDNGPLSGLGDLRRSVDGLFVKVAYQFRR